MLKRTNGEFIVIWVSVKRFFLNIYGALRVHFRISISKSVTYNFVHKIELNFFCRELSCYRNVLAASIFNIYCIKISITKVLTLSFFPISVQLTHTYGRNREKT